MKNKTISTVIVLGLLSLLVILAVQLFWVKKTIDVQKTSLAIQKKEDSLNLKEFQDHVQISLMNVLGTIQKRESIQMDMYGAVKQISNNHYTVDFNEELQPFYLETLLKKEFYLRNIRRDFYYGIYDCFTDSIVLSNRVRYKKDSIYVTDMKPLSEVTPEKLNLKKDGHYFTVYFPDFKIGSIEPQKNYSPWIYLTAMLILVTIFFSFSVSIILRQNRLAEVKTDFINNMTHEFKTPIATISLAVDALKNEKVIHDVEKSAYFTNIIKEENKRMNKQVEAILQAALLDKKEIDIHSIKANAHDLIQKAINNIELPLAEKNGKINVELTAKNDLLFVDEVHFINLINNLLDNAIKYSKETGLEIGLTTENHLNQFRVKISDNGIGMNKETSSRIFEKFYRAHTGNIHNVKGFGLGLSYVKAMVEAQKGSIKVDSILGKGTTFTLSFPVV